MSDHKILKSLLGRRFGLDDEDNLIVQATQRVATVTITSAQLLALNATPQTIVAAPGSGKILIPDLVVVRKPSGTAYAGIATGEDLAVKYTNGSGAEATSQVETTGFLDQTTEEVRVVRGLTTVVEPVANAALVLHLLVGEITTGDSDLIVRTYYRVIPSAIA